MKRQLVIGATIDKRQSATDTDVDYLDAPIDSPALVFQGSTNIYIESGAAVAVLAQQIERLLPITRESEYTAGIRSLLFSLQFTWAVDNIPRLRGWLAIADRYSNVEMWDCPIPADALGSETAQLNYIQRRFTDITTTIGKQLQEYDQKLDAGPTQLADPTTGLPLIVLGSMVDVTLGGLYLNHSGLQGPVHVLLKRNDRNLVTALQQQCPQIAVQEVFFTHLLLPANTNDCHRLWQDYQVQSNPTAQWLAPTFSAMLQALWNAQALQQLMATIRPTTVFGTFEKSPLGVVLSDPNTQGNFEVVSYQHGIMSATQTLHYFNFAKFYVWSALFKQLIDKDGYQSPESIEILDMRIKGIGNPKFHPLHLIKPRWVPRGLVVVVFEQPLQKSPMEPGDYHALLVELSRLAPLLGFTTLIKPHPRTYKDNLISNLGDGLPQVSRLTEDISLAQVLIHADIAVGMTSTALVDFMNVGKPAISFDPKHWSDLAGLPGGLFTHQASTNRELADQLTEIIGASTPTQRFLAALRTRRLI